jgi:HPr kinase/phosphorylase
VTSESGFIHASAVVIGEIGVLIEGPSGSGKSSLAAALLTDAVLFGRFGGLVGDDRLHVELRNGRLVARPHPAIAGMLERRGTGLLSMAHEPACVLGLAVVLVEEEGAMPPRLPEEAARRVLHGVQLPALTLRSGAGATENSRRVLAAITLRQSVAAEPF